MPNVQHNYSTSYTFSNNYLNNNMYGSGYNQKHDNFTIIVSIAQQNQHNTSIPQTQHAYTYQNITQHNPITNQAPANELLEHITYTISALIHAPFPQHVGCNSATHENLYTKTIKIGGNDLIVSYRGDIIPSGVYPRRLLSYLTKSLIKTKAKKPIIHIARSRAQFYKDALGINYVLSSKDAESIREQVEAFCTCKISLGYSNPNEKSRKERESISFLAKGQSWLYDDTQPWQEKIIITDEMYDLITATAVPISSVAVDIFTNARQLDILNYFLYQNYNLNLKKITATFQIEELFNLFGGGISTINEFRRVFGKILNQIKILVPLQIEILDKHRYRLTPNNDCLLKQHKRQKTNEIKDPRLAINEDFKQKLEKNYAVIDIEAASIYVLKRIERGGKPIENPHAYMRDVLKNPNWYRNERTLLIQSIHKMQFDDYKQLSDSQRKITSQDLSTRLDRTAMLGLPAELRDYYRQLKHPGQDIIKHTPNWKHLCYLYWSLMTNRCVEYSTCSVEYMFIQLFKQLS